MTEKEFAIELKNKFWSDYNKYENFSSLYYPEASIPVEKLDLDKLSIELEKYDLKVSKGCDLKHISKQYLNEWNKFKTIFVYTSENDL